MQRKYLLENCVLEVINIFFVVGKYFKNLCIDAKHVKDRRDYNTLLDEIKNYSKFVLFKNLLYSDIENYYYYCLVR